MPEPPKSRLPPGARDCSRQALSPTQQKNLEDPRGDFADLREQTGIEIDRQLRSSG
jgi:hypothetical protein